MRFTLVVAAVVAVTLAACNGGRGVGTQVETKTETVSATPTAAQSSSEATSSSGAADPVEELATANPTLLSDVCDEYTHLVGVGWPENIVPAMLVGDNSKETVRAFAEASGVTVYELQNAGLLPLPAMLPDSRIALLETAGDATDVITQLAATYC